MDKDWIKIVGSIVMFISGIGLGVYVGIWLMFIGGIVGIIEAIRAETLVAMDVAISIAKIIFAAPIGWLCVVVLVIPASIMLKD